MEEILTIKPLNYKFFFVIKFTRLLWAIFKRKNDLIMTFYAKQKKAQ